MKKLNLTIIDEAGLHARPASVIAKEASKYTSKIELTYKERVINLKSVIKIVGSAIPQHAEISITFEGDDEVAAYENVEKLFKEFKLA